MKIYRKCTSELYSFLTIDTTLPTNDPFRFRKKSFRFIIKSTLTDELNILGDKIKVNQAQYELGREVAKIYSLSSDELEKYKYLTDEDLWYKPGVVEKEKFDLFSIGKSF